MISKEIKTSLCCCSALLYARMNTTGVLLCCRLTSVLLTLQPSSFLFSIQSRKKPEVNNLIWNFNTLCINDPEKKKKTRGMGYFVKTDLWRWSHCFWIFWSVNRVGYFKESQNTRKRFQCRNIYRNGLNVYKSGVKLEFCLDHSLAVETRHVYPAVYSNNALDKWKRLSF